MQECAYLNLNMFGTPPNLPFLPVRLSLYLFSRTYCCHQKFWTHFWLIRSKVYFLYRSIQKTVYCLSLRLKKCSYDGEIFRVDVLNQDSPSTPTKIIRKRDSLQNKRPYYIWYLTLASKLRETDKKDVLEKNFSKR